MNTFNHFENSDNFDHISLNHLDYFDQGIIFTPSDHFNQFKKTII